jgi:hypothetical protein
MSSSAVKENANPTVHAVRRRRLVQTAPQQLLGYESLQPFMHPSKQHQQQSSDELHVGGSLTTTTDATARAVLMALSDIAAYKKSNNQNEGNSNSNKPNTGPKLLKILSDAGFHITPKPELLGFQSPVFVPADRGSRAEPMVTDSTKVERDAVNEEEVFDMIRTINDPEHPLTLEQLNVVSADDIIVVDTLARTEAERKMDPHALSTVAILFT